MHERDELIKKLFLDEYDQMLRKAYRLTGDICLAQDIVQETFVFALAHPKELLSHPKPVAWLSTVLYNIAMNERRRWDNSRNISLDQMGDIFSAEPPVDFAEIMPDFLRDDEKQLLRMRFVEKLSYREISEKLGISEGAYRVKYSRLMKKIRRQLASSEKSEKACNKNVFSIHMIVEENEV